MKSTHYLIQIKNKNREEEWTNNTKIWSKEEDAKQETDSLRKHFPEHDLRIIKVEQTIIDY